MKARKMGGYSTVLAAQYIDSNKETRCLSTTLNEKVRFEDGKPTVDVTGYEAWFTQEGLEPFKVKFADKIVLPEYLEVVSFESLEAVEVNYNVYFKAKNLSKVK